MVMKRILSNVVIRLIICLLALLLGVTGAWAKPTTPDQARNVVLNWLVKDAVPLGAHMGRQIKEVQTFSDQAGNPAYYVVYMDPAGLVFLPADDLVEPIIGFLPEGQYDPSPVNPLGALVSRDIPGRVYQAREMEAKGLEALAPDAPQAKAQRKWTWLSGATAGSEALEFGINPISDPRVSPLTQSLWDQAGADGSLPEPTCNYPCYNYFTPPYGTTPSGGGDARNYVSGCVATAMSQLMRYWSYPTNGIGVHSMTYYVSDVSHSGNTRGGNDSGGAYVWSNMPLATNSATTDTQRAAIGRLLWDAGLSVGMNYDTLANGGSGADTLQAGSAFTSTFQYSNARTAVYDNSYTNLPGTNRNNMVNPNLHAGYPILFGITGSVGGHAIVGDGYGYDGGSTMYTHLNMGWSGSDNLWYNLPNIDSSPGFTSVYKCIYNVYRTGSGEIIAGRVTDSGGNPIAGVTVTATVGGQTYPAMQKDVVATTTSSGIYAIPKVPSNTTFTVSASKLGYSFTPQSVTTGTSSNGTWSNPSIDCGNVWGGNANFVAGSGPSLTMNQALDNTRLSFNNLDEAVWFPETATYYYGGSAAQSGAITDNQYTRLQTTVVGPGTLSFWWKVSSETDYDYLHLYIDGVDTDWISGEVDWTQRTYHLPPGIHTIIWQYSKDGSVSEPPDCGWVDKVVYSPPGGAAVNLLPLD